LNVITFVAGGMSVRSQNASGSIGVSPVVLVPDVVIGSAVVVALALVLPVVSGSLVGSSAPVVLVLVPGGLAVVSSPGAGPSSLQAALAATMPATRATRDR